MAKKKTNQTKTKNEEKEKSSPPDYFKWEEDELNNSLGKTNTKPVEWSFNSNNTNDEVDTSGK